MAVPCRKELSTVGAPQTRHRHRKIRGGFRCSAGAGGDGNRETPRLLKVAVAGATELLRLLPSPSAPNKKQSWGKPGGSGEEELSIRGVEDVVSILQSDYERAYFLTGNFTLEIYSDDCLFEDPTIKFRGKDQYSKNLQLLVPFFDRPSLSLEKIEKGVNLGTEFVFATWELRTYLRLPWRPLISIDGNTTYDLDDKFRIVRHAERWDISALEAVGQIFKPSIWKG